MSPAESALSLVERLLAALDRAEEIARAASYGPWVVGSSFGAQNTRVFQEGSLVDSVGQAVFQAQVSNSPQCRENAAFIAANGPDVVLRTVAAHRKILDEFDRVKGRSAQALDEGQNDLVIALRAKEVALEVAVHALASIYLPEERDPS